MPEMPDKDRVREIRYLLKHKKRMKKPIKVTVCWVCKTGGHKLKGGLIRISETDYAHQECFILHGKPKIANSSYISRKYEEKTETKEKESHAEK
jgi:hypothetical protein